MADKLRVLYVDDEPDLLNIGKLFLEREGVFAVDTLTSARVALEQLNTEQYDVVISDYQMPDMDGITFLKMLKASGNTTPFIIFTGRGREEVVIEALNSGADFYLQKGGEPGAQFTELVHKVRSAVTRKHAEEELVKKNEELNASYEQIAAGEEELRANLDVLISQERALRESEEKLAAIVAGSPVPKFVIDCDHTIIYWNRALEQTTGISAAQVIGTRDQWRAFYPQERPTMADLVLDGAFVRVQELYEGKFSESPVVTGAFEATDFFPYMGETGTWLRFMAAPIKNIHGVMLGVVETLIDVSDIKRAEVELVKKNEEINASYEQIAAGEEELRANLDELVSQERALRESKKELADIIEFLPDATFAVNAGGVVIAWNHAMEVLTEVKQADMLNKGNYEYSLPIYLERRPILIDLVFGYDVVVAKKYPGIKREGNKLIAEVFIPHFHCGRGAYIWFTASPLYDSQGKISGAIESIREITEQKEREAALNQRNEELGAAYEEITATEEELRQQVDEIATAQQALQESEQKYRNVVEDQTEFICRFLPNGTHIFVNDAYCRYFEKKREKIIGHRFRPVIHPDDWENVARSIAALTPEHPLITIDQRIIMPDGSIRWQRWVDRAIFGENGCVVEYQSVGRDFTEHKEIEKEREYYTSELAKYSTSLDAANEKLTLLSSITRHDINNQLTVLRGYLSFLEDLNPDPTYNEYFLKISTAAKRISAMIRFTKEYEQIGTNAPAWQDPHTLVNTAAKQAPLGKVLVKNDFPAGMEVLADPLVVKVFYNLMDNAVRYGGKITTIRFSAEETGDEHLIVCEDDGEGVLAEEKEKIFERGFGKNTGLGLALSREILSITGIAIKETGEPGKGARFEMLVPEGAWQMRKEVGV